MRRSGYYRTICVLLAAFAVLMLFAGCGAGSKDSAAVMENSAGTFAPTAAEGKADYDYSYSADDMGYTGGTVTADSNVSMLAADAGRKLIWRGSMELESLEYEKSEEALFALVAECGGYIESSQRSGGNVSRYSGIRSLRYGRFTVRIPADKFQYFINAGGTVATVLSTSTGSEDVTESYFDIEARLSVLRVKEERLIAMLEKGEELEYLIQIENELADTRYEIETLTGTLRRFDGLISYSTVEVSLSEVTKPTEVVEPDPQSAWDRIGARFKASVKEICDGAVEIFVFIVGYSPVILAAAVIIVVITVAARRSVRRRKTRSKKDETSQTSETQENPEGK